MAEECPEEQKGKTNKQTNTLPTPQQLTTELDSVVADSAQSFKTQEGCIAGPDLYCFS